MRCVYYPGVLNQVFARNFHEYRVHMYSSADRVVVYRSVFRSRRPITKTWTIVSSDASALVCTDTSCNCHICYLFRVLCRSLRLSP